MLRSVPALSAAVLHTDLLTFKPPTAPALRESRLKHLDLFKERLGFTARYRACSDSVSMPAVVILIPHDPMPGTAELIPRPGRDEEFRARLQFACSGGDFGSHAPIVAYRSNAT